MRKQVAKIPGGGTARGFVKVDTDRVGPAQQKLFQMAVPMQRHRSSVAVQCCGDGLGQQDSPFSQARTKRGDICGEKARTGLLLCKAETAQACCRLAVQRRQRPAYLMRGFRCCARRNAGHPAADNGTIAIRAGQKVGNLERTGRGKNLGCTQRAGIAFGAMQFQNCNGPVLLPDLRHKPASWPITQRNDRGIARQPQPCQ